MKKVYIIALHLAFGGIEKAICSMANLFVQKYDVEIISVYNMPDAPAFPLDERVRVRYLLDDVPNREQWHCAVKSLNPVAVVRESMKSVKILREKKQAVIDAIYSINDGVIITTRHEDNILLSKYGRRGVLKIAQLHHDHRFESNYVESFRKEYNNIDILAMLTPGLADEVREMMYGENTHTRVEYIPNFLEHFPEKVELNNREKIVLSVGRLNALKRFDLLIEQFALLHDRAPDWKLRIVGEGEEHEKLSRRIAELSAEGYITLTGKLDGEAVEREMLRASVFAMSSSTEGFPFVLLEAQSCALPVLAFDVRVGPGFVVRSGDNGFLVADGATGRYRERMLELMESPELRHDMAVSALRKAAEFSAERVREKWFSVIGD